MKYNPPSGSTDPNAPFVTGNAVTKTKGSAVPAEAVEYDQREIVNAIIAAELTPANNDLTQLTQAIELLAKKQLPGIATLLDNGICRPDGVTLKIDTAGKLSVVAASKYEVGEFYLFRHPSLRTGFAPCQGGILANAVTQYPELWAYLQTAEGQLLLKTEADWQAMSTATWATLADGTKVGWNGIGGVPYYVQDLATGTLRLPDLRGMYAEAAGFDSLGVGDVRGDQIRNILGGSSKSPTGLADLDTVVGTPLTGAFTSVLTGVPGADFSIGGATTGIFGLRFDASRAVPTGAANAPRRWGALACCYLGIPAS